MGALGSIGLLLIVIAILSGADVPPAWTELTRPRDGMFSAGTSTNPDFSPA